METDLPGLQPLLPLSHGHALVGPPFGPDFSLEDSPELYCCVFSVIFVWDKIFFLRYFFRLVQLVYHGSSHAHLHMCTAC